MHLLAAAFDFEPMRSAPAEHRTWLLAWLRLPLYRCLLALPLCLKVTCFYSWPSAVLLRRLLLLGLLIFCCLKLLFMSSHCCRRFESDLNPRPGPNRITSDRIALIVRLSSAICDGRAASSICAFLLSAWKRNFTINQIICMQFNVSLGHKSIGCSRAARAVGIV